MGRLGDIIARVEQIRLHFGLSKSGFAESLRMDFRTYDAFVGSLGNKPNVALLHGIAHRFGVHPLWLLTGRGEKFMSESAADLHPTVAPVPVPTSAPDVNASAGPGVPAMNAAFARISELLAKLDDSVTLSQGERLALMERVSSALARYLAQYPQQVDEELIALLEGIEQRLSDAHLPN